MQAIRALASVSNEGPSLSQQRKQHANLQESIQGLWNSAKLFQKAIQYFDGKLHPSACMFRVHVLVYMYM